VATGLASVGVAAAVIGVNGVRTFFDTVLPALTRETGWIYNQSLGGLLSRAGDHSVLSVGAGSTALHVAVLAGAVALLGLAAWVVRPGQRDDAERGAEFGLAVTAMLLAGSIAWYPHFTHALIPMAAAAGLVAHRGWRVERRVGQAAIALLLLLGLVAPLVLASIDMQTIESLHRSGAWWPALQLFSLPALAALALVAALVASLRRPAPEQGWRAAAA